VSVSGPALRQAMLALAAPAVASGAVPPGRATRLAAAWAAYVATGERGPSRTLSLAPGLERPRTPGGTMASSVHRGNRLAYDINAVDAITGRRADLSGITWTATVEPSEAGELTQPDADGKFDFLPNEESEVSTCAVEMRAEFADESEAQILTDSVTIDPDGRVLGMGQGVEQPRAGG
jgi:hypothetical protein